jgi:hypothetical protein
MREIVPPRCSVIQTAVFVAARPAGFGPALIVALSQRRIPDGAHEFAFVDSEAGVIARVIAPPPERR